MTHNKLNGASYKVAMKTQSTAFTAIPAGLTYAKRVGSEYLFVYSAKKSTINGAYSKPNLSSHVLTSYFSSFRWHNFDYKSQSCHLLL
jgi:hypothetical protein